MLRQTVQKSIGSSFDKSHIFQTEEYTLSVDDYLFCSPSESIFSFWVVFFVSQPRIYTINTLCLFIHQKDDHAVELSVLCFMFFVVLSMPLELLTRIFFILSRNCLHILHCFDFWFLIFHARFIITYEFTNYVTITKYFHIEFSQNNV